VLAIGAVVLPALFWSTGRSLGAPPKADLPAPASVVRVLRIVDGDTVVLDGVGGAITVRLIGVDTPETVHPRKPVEHFGLESSAFLKTLIGGKRVRVEYEPGSSHLDKYGRTLAYLYLEPGGVFVNREIIARGYGFAYTKYPFAFLEDFRAAERVARAGRLGLWGAEPEPTDADTKESVFVMPAGTRYHRSGCRYLTKGATAIPLERAATGYSPCSVCRPRDLKSNATATSDPGHANHFEPDAASGFFGAGASSSFSNTPATCAWSLIAVASAKAGPPSSITRSRPASYAKAFGPIFEPPGPSIMPTTTPSLFTACASERT
jgi:micrococcal nuclease